MLESFLRTAPGPVIAIVQHVDTYGLDGFPDDTEVLHVPGLSLGSPRQHRRALTRFGNALRASRWLAVLGADYLDGSYQLREAIGAWTLLEVAARSGRDSRAVGFSWKRDVSPAVCKAAQRATSAGVTAYVRDPLSVQRALADGLSNVHGVADTAFLSAGPTAQETGCVSRLALVNVSGLIHRNVDLVGEYVMLVEWLVRRGMTVHLIPTSANPSGNDIEACRAVRERLHVSIAAQVELMDPIPSPAAILDLARQADFVVTGRMHLAVLSLSVGTPAIALSAHDKMLGMMELLGCADYVVQPGPGVFEEVKAKVEHYQEDRDERRSALERRLPHVRCLAEASFRDL